MQVFSHLIDSPSQLLGVSVEKAMEQNLSFPGLAALYILIFWGGMYLYTKLKDV